MEDLFRSFKFWDEWLQPWHPCHMHVLKGALQLSSQYQM